MTEPAEPDLELPSHLANLWRLSTAGTRGPKPGLTLDRIVETAIAIADADGLAGLSMSRVAKELGFSTMSLYRYVATKDELLLLAQDAAFGPPPALQPGAGWRAALRGWAEAELAAYRRHRWSLQIPVAGPPLMPSQLAWLDAGLGMLTETQLHPNEKTSSILLVTSYVRGVAQLESELEAGRLGSGLTTEEISKGVAKMFELVITPERFPHVYQVSAAGGFDDEIRPEDRGLDHEFRFGLDRVLDGIEMLVQSRKR
jgi:AcrR family transcriptional regulator